MTESEAETITIKVKESSIGTIPFRVKMNTKMGKVLNAFCKKCELDPKGVAFLGPTGEKINDSDTAESLNLEEDDIIEAMAHQEGGQASL